MPLEDDPLPESPGLSKLVESSDGEADDLLDELDEALDDVEDDGFVLVVDELLEEAEGFAVVGEELGVLGRVVGLVGFCDGVFEVEADGDADAEGLSLALGDELELALGEADSDGVVSQPAATFSAFVNGRVAVHTSLPFSSVSQMTSGGYATHFLSVSSQKYSTRDTCRCVSSIPVSQLARVRTTPVGVSTGPGFSPGSVDSLSVALGLGEELALVVADGDGCDVVGSVDGLGSGA